MSKLKSLCRVRHCLVLGYHHHLGLFVFPYIVDCSGPDKRWLRICEMPCSSRQNVTVDLSSIKQNLTPSSSDLDTLFKKISKDQPVVLSVTPGYLDAYVSLYVQGTLPKHLTEYYKEVFASLKVSPEQAN